jgi:hypothetical protein
MRPTKNVGLFRQLLQPHGCHGHPEASEPGNHLAVPLPPPPAHLGQQVEQGRMVGPNAQANHVQPPSGIPARNLDARKAKHVRRGRSPEELGEAAESVMVGKGKRPNPELSRTRNQSSRGDGTVRAGAVAMQIDARGRGLWLEVGGLSCHG